MCECRLCDCWFLYCLKWHGCSAHYICCGAGCCLPETNKLLSSCELCGLSFYCCNGCIGLGGSCCFLFGSVFCSPPQIFVVEQAAVVGGGYPMPIGAEMTNQLADKEIVQEQVAVDMTAGQVDVMVTY